MMSLVRFHDGRGIAAGLRRSADLSLNWVRSHCGAPPPPQEPNG